MVFIFFGFIGLLIYFFLSSRKKPNLEGEVVVKLKPLVPLVFPANFALLVGALVVALNVFLYDAFGSSKVPVLGLAAFNTVWVVGLLHSIAKAKRSWFVWVLAALSISVGWLSLIRANGFVQAANIHVMAGSTLLLLIIFSFDYVHWQGIRIVGQLLKFLITSVVQIRRLFMLNRGQKKSGEEEKISVATVIKTSAITLVVLLFFANLLSSADPVFNQIIKEVREQAIGRVIFSLLLAAVVSAALTVRFKNKREATGVPRLGWFSFHDIIVPLIGIVGLFAVFLAVQVRYLFGVHEDLTSFGLESYSEYVRKGFIELIVTAFFGGVLAYVVNLKARFFKKNTWVSQLKVLNVVFITELFFVLGSALKRDLLYVEVYGLTRVRIIGGLFLFWLAALFVSLLLMAIYKHLKEKQLLVGMFGASVVVVLLLNIINVDQLVVNYDSDSIEAKDYFYINNLSSDGYLGWEGSITYTEQLIEKVNKGSSITAEDKARLVTAKLAMISLKEKRDKLFIQYASEEWLVENAVSLDSKSTQIERLRVQKKPSKSLSYLRDWRNYNVADVKAFQELFNNQDLYIKRLNTVLRKTNVYQKAYGVNTYQEERRFLYDFSYPFIDVNLDYSPRRLQKTKKIKPAMPSLKNNKDASPSAEQKPKNITPPSPSPSVRQEEF